MLPDAPSPARCCCSREGLVWRLARQAAQHYREAIALRAEVSRLRAILDDAPAIVVDDAAFIQRTRGVKA